MKNVVKKEKIVGGLLAGSKAIRRIDKSGSKTISSVEALEYFYIKFILSAGLTFPDDEDEDDDDDDKDADAILNGKA